MDRHAARLLQPLAERQHRRMFDGGSNYFRPPRLGFECGEDRGIIGFGAAGGEDDLVIELRPQERLQLLPPLLHRRPNLRPEGVHRGGVPELLGEKRQHRINDPRIDPRRGVIIEVDRAHGVSPLNDRRERG